MSDDVAVRFSLDASNFQKGLATVADGFAGFTSKLSDTKIALAGVAVALGAVKLASLVKDAINLGDELKRMAEVTGISVTSLSGLRVAAELSDTSLQQVAGAVKFLQKNLVEAQNQSSDTAAVFRALGIDAQKAMNMDPGDLLSQVGLKLSGIENASLRTAAGMKILGKSPQELTPLFNSLKEGKELADKFGLSIGNNFANDSDTFNDQLTVMNLILKDVGISLAEKVLPTLIAVGKWALNALTGFSKFTGVLTLISTTLKIVATAFIAVGGVVEVVIDQVFRLAQMLTRFLALDFKGVATAFGAAGRDLTATVSGVGKSISDIWATATDSASNSVKTSTEKSKMDYTALKNAVIGSAKEKSEAERKAAEDGAKYQREAIADAMKLNREYLDFYLETGAATLVDKKRVIENELALVEKGTSEEIKLRRELLEVERELQGEIQTGVEDTARVTKKAYGDVFEEIKKGFKSTLGDVKFWENRFKTSLENISEFSRDAWSTFSNGFGRSVADAIVDGKNLSDSLEAVFKDIAKNFIAQIATMTAEWLAYKALVALGVVTPPIAGVGAGAAGAGAAGTAAGTTAAGTAAGTTAAGTAAGTTAAGTAAGTTAAGAGAAGAGTTGTAGVGTAGAGLAGAAAIGAGAAIVVLFGEGGLVDTIQGHERALTDNEKQWTWSYSLNNGLLPDGFPLSQVTKREYYAAKRHFRESGNDPSQGSGDGNQASTDPNQMGGVGFADGGSFMTTRPQMFLAGERGPERITVSPAGTAASLPGASGTGGSFTFNGPVIMDEITMRNFARMTGRLSSIEAQRYAR